MGEEEEQVIEEQETTVEGQETQEQADEQGEQEAEVSETEQAAETEESESAPDKKVKTQEEKDEIQKRFDKLTWEKRETERKLDLITRMGPKAYYEAFPEERPAHFKPEAEKPAAEKPIDYKSLVVEGGAYNGYRLVDLIASADVDARIAGQEMLTEFKIQQATSRYEKQAKEKAIDAAYSNELTSFKMSRAKELFSKEKDFTKEEIAQVDTLSEQVAKWMLDNNKISYSIEDAFFIMNKDKLLTDAATRGVKSTVASLNKKGAAHIGGGPSAGTSPYDGIKTETDLQKYLTGKSESEIEAFYADKKNSLRKKFPSLPWDD